MNNFHNGFCGNGFGLVHHEGQLSETKGKQFAYLVNGHHVVAHTPMSVASGNIHLYPVEEARPIRIAVNSVLDVPGVTNALFMVGSMGANEDLLKYSNVNIAISDNAINACEDNRQAFLLLKEGGAHTLAFSTGVVPSFLYEQRHLFNGHGAAGVVGSHFGDFAGQDLAAEGIGGERECPCGDDTIAIVNWRPNINTGDRSKTFEVRLYDVKCGRKDYMYSEFWHILPMDDEFGNFITGRDIRERDTDRRDRRENSMILGRGTNTGAVVLAAMPNHIHRPRRGYVYAGNSGKASFGAWGW